MGLVELILAVHRQLDEAGVGHAFGGALALAYVAEPRGTVDVDVNVFLPPDSLDRVVAAFEPLGLQRPAPADDPHPPIAGVRFEHADDPFPVDVFPALDERYREIEGRGSSDPSGGAATSCPSSRPRTSAPSSCPPAGPRTGSTWRPSPPPGHISTSISSRTFSSPGAVRACTRAWRGSARSCAGSRPFRKRRGGGGPADGPARCGEPGWGSPSAAPPTGRSRTGRCRCGTAGRTSR
ncbi:MAG: hypothetical protein QOG43_454 [Actinomycetota bacterium]|nr:hypothetical protein [Actinomycetota bacterium]